MRGTVSIACAWRCRLRSAALVIAMIACAVPARAQNASIPPAQVVQMRCTVCHATDLLEQQRLTREGWRRELSKMMGWGAAIDAARVDEVAAYLAKRYAPPAARTPIAADASAGGALLMTRCTVCHATDLIAAQRLDADGWRRELAKMTAWGAVLSPDERTTVLDYLSPPDARR